MSDDSKTYLLDSDVLISIKHRADFKHIYSELRKLAQEGLVKTVRQVFKEMKDDPILKQEILSYRKSFEISAPDQYCSDVASRITILGEKASYLWAQTGGSTKDPADPWLVAVASKYGHCLVTNESQRSDKRIPAACKLPEMSCQCISGPHFLYEQKIVTEIDPAHISPKDFFGE